MHGSAPAIELTHTGEYPGNKAVVRLVLNDGYIVAEQIMSIGSFFQDYMEVFERYNIIMDSINELLPESGFDIFKTQLQALKDKYGDAAVPEAELVTILEGIRKREEIIDVETDPSTIVTPGRVLFESYQERMGFHETWEARNDQVKDAYEYAAEKLKDFFDQQ